MIDRLKRTQAGFTLVELIVVIAILAILASVAIPVYSGYIGKANEAADLQLLSAVNTAWTAACAEKGLDPTHVIGQATLTGEAGSKTVTGISASGVDAAANAALNASFLQFYGENAASPFKVYESLGYDVANGVFVDGAREYTFNTALGTVTITAAQLSAYQASTFAKIGTSQLLGNIDDLVDSAVSALVHGNTSLDTEAGYQAFLSEHGLDYSTMTEREKANALVLYVASLSKQVDVNAWVEAMSNGTTPEGEISPGNINTPMVLDGAIQYGMMLAYARSSEDATLTFTETTPGESTNITSRKNDDVKDLLSGATLDNMDEYRSAINAYLSEQINNGVYPEGSTIDFYYNETKVLGVTITEPGTTTSTTENAMEYFNNLNINSVNDVAAAYAAIAGTDEFKSYAATQGAADLSGYLAALGMISDNTDAVNLEQILSTGFSDQTSGVEDMINIVLGNP